MKRQLLLILIIVSICSGVSLAAEANIEVKMLHVFVKADVNEVRFENLWVFQREKEEGGWDVEIEVDKAGKVSNWAGEIEGNVLKADLEDGSRVDSVGFTFYKANVDGECEVGLPLGYAAESVVVYVSGAQSRLVSEQLEYSEYMSSRSRYSHVYSGKGIRGGGELRFRIDGLPRSGDSVVEIVTICSLVLIVIIGLITLYTGRKATRE